MVVALVWRETFHVHKLVEPPSTQKNVHDVNSTQLCCAMHGHSVHHEGRTATAMDGVRALRSLGGMLFCEPWAPYNGYTSF